MKHNQAGSCHCDSRSALEKTHISFLKISLPEINGLQNYRKDKSEEYRRFV